MSYYYYNHFVLSINSITKHIGFNIDLYNSQINIEQLQAVRNIAMGPRNDATYIILGPPGTGKTTTLVEGILQLLRKPGTKILVTAASNSACDEIGLRLCKFLTDLDIARCLVRIYARSCEDRSESIEENLLENSNMYNGHFYPDIEILHNYRVVICTLSVVAKLATGKFGRYNNGDGVYTHLVIDEVAAAMESEALMAITTILTAKSSLIISGDHKQLGPVLKSKRAKELGLDASLMDRLMARDCYRVDVDTGDYDRTIQTRLIRNYRSHPAIVDLYSGLYYNHSLIACAKQENTSLCETWHKLRNKSYPILFHAIYAPSKSDRQSHSLLNFTEVKVVMDYVKDLMFYGINCKPVKEDDIGIISPYKKQYRYIREELNLRKWFGIETGSVETFQGKEKKIIIVSFVRSGTENLGFLDNPRRLNVTLSRPKCILILIGNPITLSLNKEFEYIIKECKRNNAFFGSSKPSTSDVKQMPTEANVKSSEILSPLKKELQEHKRKQTNPGENLRNSIRNKDNTKKDHLDVVDLVALNLEEKPGKNKKSDKSSRRQGNRRRGRRGNRKNSNKGDGNGNNNDNKKDTKSDEDDNDDDNDYNDDDDIDNKSQASGNTNIAKYPHSNINDKKDYNNDILRSDLSSKTGRISSEKSADKWQQNTNQDGAKLDAMFKQLPKVPAATAYTAPTAPPFSANQLSLLQQQQQQYLQNLHQNSHCYQNQQQYPYFQQNYSHNTFNRPYFNPQTTTANSFTPTVPACNPYMINQSQPRFNTQNVYPFQMNMNYSGFNNFNGPPNNYQNTFVHQNNANVVKGGQEKELAVNWNRTKDNAGKGNMNKCNFTKNSSVESNKQNISAKTTSAKENHSISNDDKPSTGEQLRTNFNTFDTPSGPKADKPITNTNDCSGDFILSEIRDEQPSSSVRIFKQLAAAAPKAANFVSEENLIVPNATNTYILKPLDKDKASCATAANKVTLKHGEDETKIYPSAVTELKKLTDGAVNLAAKRKVSDDIKANIAEPLNMQNPAHNRDGKPAVPIRRNLFRDPLSTRRSPSLTSNCSKSSVSNQPQTVQKNYSDASLNKTTNSLNNIYPSINTFNNTSVATERQPECIPIKPIYEERGRTSPLLYKRQTSKAEEKSCVLS